MKISRSSLGQAVRAVREAAGLTLNDLAAIIGVSASSLSRSETGQRDLGYTEVLAIADAAHIGVETLRALAETFESAESTDVLERQLLELKRMSIEMAIEARTAAKV